MGSKIRRARFNGLTICQWCEQNNYSIHTYNYRKHLLKEALANQILPDIVPVVISDPEAQNPPASVQQNSALTNCTIRATAKLSINSISIDFDSDASEEFLRTIIKAVRYA